MYCKSTVLISNKVNISKSLFISPLRDQNSIILRQSPYSVRWRLQSALLILHYIPTYLQRFYRNFKMAPPLTWALCCIGLLHLVAGNEQVARHQVVIKVNKLVGGRMESNHHCSGVIIEPRFILSTGKCVQELEWVTEGGLLIWWNSEAFWALGRTFSHNCSYLETVRGEILDQITVSGAI